MPMTNQEKLDAAKVALKTIATTNESLSRSALREIARDAFSQIWPHNNQMSIANNPYILENGSSWTCIFVSTFAWMQPTGQSQGTTYPWNLGGEAKGAFKGLEGTNVDWDATLALWAASSQ